MSRPYTNPRPIGQSISIPTAHFDGLSRDDLQAAKVHRRLRFSRETAAEIARLAYGISEKLERRI